MRITIDTDKKEITIITVSEKESISVDRLKQMVPDLDDYSIVITVENVQPVFPDYTVRWPVPYWQQFYVTNIA